MSRESIKAEVAAMTAAILAGESVPRRPRRSRAAQTKRAYQPRTRTPLYSYQEMADLRAEGHSITEIIQKTGAHRTTVIVALRELGVYEPDKSRLPGEKCPKGLHMMSEHGRPVMKDGKQNGRYCVPCKATGALERRAKAAADGHTRRVDGASTAHVPALPQAPRDLPRR